MAKANPTVTKPETAPVGATATMDPPTAPPASDVQAVMIELPLKRTKGYPLSNIGDLPRDTAQELRDLADGLAAEGLKLANGKPVKESRDALIWLFQQTKAGRSS